MEEDQVLHGEEQEELLDDHVIHLEVIGLERSLYAGLSYWFAFEASCSRGCDLDGITVLVVSSDNAVLATERLEPVGDEGVFRTAEAEIAMPSNPGECTWRMILLPGDDEAIPSVGSTFVDTPAMLGEAPVHETVGGWFSFSVEPHATSMSVWGLHGPVPAGKPFEISVGVQCCAGCDISGTTVSVYDADGVACASGTLWGCYGESADLYQTEITIKAPDDIGLFAWTAVCDTETLALDHEGSSRAFTFATAVDPDCSLEFSISDSATGKALEGAAVTLVNEGCYPYRARSGTDGTAELSVPSGDYRLTALLADYDAFRIALTVEEGSLSVSVPLVYNPDMGG